MRSKVKDLDYYAGKFAKLTNENKKLKIENKELKKQLNLHVVVGRSEQLVCDCGSKPKDVPNDGYEYICNKCRRPFAN